MKKVIMKQLFFIQFPLNNKLPNRKYKKCLYLLDTNTFLLGI